MSGDTAGELAGDQAGDEFRARASEPLSRDGRDAVQRGPSAALALAGLAALAVAGWGLIGPDAFEAVDVRWVLVAAAAVVGVVLVLVPARKGRGR